MKKIRLSRYWIALITLPPSPPARSSISAETERGRCRRQRRPRPHRRRRLPVARQSANANLVVVAMGNDIGPSSVPKYGTINGYAVVLGGSFSGHASLINQWLNQGVLSLITSKNVLQFTNVDSGGALHSAVGFKGNSFPPVPYTFPTAAASPTATAVSTSSLWSTGRIAASVSQQCYSQTFTLSPGVYYFGDLDYYNLSNFRDVLIVASPPPARFRWAFSGSRQQRWR